MSMRNNRPRGSIQRDDFGDELNLWGQILEKVKKANSLHEKYNDCSTKIPQVEANVPEDDPNAAIASLSELESLHRESIRLAESEAKVLNEEPDDLLSKVDTLISVRAAFEETPQPQQQQQHNHRNSGSQGNTTAKTSARNAKRRLDSTATDGSIDTPSGGTPDPTINTPSSTTNPPPGKLAKASTRTHSMTSQTVKSETSSNDPMETVKNVASEKATTPNPTITSQTITTTTTTTTNSSNNNNNNNNTSSTSPSSSIEKFPLNSEVFYKNSSKKSEGEGILCQVIKIDPIPTGSNNSSANASKMKRYKIQDTEPDPDDEGDVPSGAEEMHLSTYKAAETGLIAIPSSSKGLEVLSKGKGVVALYPNTNTFYKAEMVGMVGGAGLRGKNGTGGDWCRLRFEGEDEEGREVEVERRYVLDVK